MTKNVIDLTLNLYNYKSRRLGSLRSIIEYLPMYLYEICLHSKSREYNHSESV